MVLIIMALGVFVVNQIDRDAEKYTNSSGNQSLTKVQTVTPTRPQIVPPVIVRTKEQENAYVRDNAQKEYSYYRRQFSVISKLDTPTDPEEAAGGIQEVYNIADNLDRLQSQYENFHLTKDTVGFSADELKNLRKEAYWETIHRVNALSGIGYSNRCIWEGGCFGSIAEISSVRSELQKRFGALNR